MSTIRDHFEKYRRRCEMGNQSAHDETAVERGFRLKPYHSMMAMTPTSGEDFACLVVAQHMGGLNNDLDGIEQHIHRYALRLLAVTK